MKRSIWMKSLAGLAVLTLTAGVADAQYTSGDLIVGFTSGSGNDLVYDLGRYSSLTNGQSWDLNPALTTSPGSYTSLGNLNWGVVGTLSLGLSGSQKTVYSTVTDAQGAIPANVPNTSTFNTIRTSVDTIGQFITSGKAGIDAANDPASWNGETLVGGSATFLNNYGSATVNDPNSTTPANFTLGVVEDLYGVTADNTPANLLGTFTFAPSGTLTFNASSVPEPATLSLLGGLGVCLLAMRRRPGFLRKN